MLEAVEKTIFPGTHRDTAPLGAFYIFSRDHESLSLLDTSLWLLTQG
jgi:hypothetical protein